MARMARLVVPLYPHHVVQRGNRKQNIFFCERDKKYYLKLLRYYARRAGVTFLAWCLMDNHVHFIAVPAEKDSLHRTFAKTHRRYSQKINQRYDWKGYLFQGRFFSYVLSNAHLYNAMRYVELNPVKAELVTASEDYPWSSARYHIYGTKDMLCSHDDIQPVRNWQNFLSIKSSSDETVFEKHVTTGRPLGDDSFIEHLELHTKRSLRKQKPGRKPNMGTHNLISV